jgi:surface carbohydrate biosynthesis protein (TIGR04326 family)
MKETPATARLNVVIWDRVDEPPGECSGSVVVLWRTYCCATDKGRLSMPDYLEENAVEIRSAYLSFVKDLGKRRILGKTIVDHFRIRPALSAWWMSLIFESSHISSSHLVDRLKLIAFDLWAADKPLVSLHLVSNNWDLREAASQWCKTSRVSFSFKSDSCNHVTDWRIRLSFRLVLLLCRSLLTYCKNLVTFATRRALRQSISRRSLNNILFVDYSANMKKEALFKHSFQSAYWGPLVDKLSQSGHHTTWLHIFVKDRVFSGLRAFRIAMSVLNKKNSQNQHHICVDSEDTIQGLLGALATWALLAVKSPVIFLVLLNLCEDYSYLLPLIGRDWIESFVGPTSISNMLFVSRFETLLSGLPYQRLGFYLQENQHWEIAFVYAWKAKGHGSIIGIPHSTVRFWDLRYFSDSSCYQEDASCSVPLPSFVALNGAYAFNAYKTALYPVEQLIRLETLRYSHLFEYKNASASLSVHNTQIRILALGDYLDACTLRQLQFLADSLELAKRPVKVFFKPHPVSSLDLISRVGIDINLVEEANHDLIGKYDIYFVGSGSSVAIDFYFASERIVTYLDPDMLNLSPLRGLTNVHYAKTPFDLAFWIDNIQTIKRCSVSPSDYFYYQQSLPKWSRVISSFVNS